MVGSYTRHSKKNFRRAMEQARPPEKKKTEPHTSWIPRWVKTLLAPLMRIDERSAERDGIREKGEPRLFTFLWKH